MVVNVSPEMIAKFELERKAKLAVTQAEYAQLEQARQEQQLRIKEKVEATRLNELHIAEKDYICENKDCGKIIPKGTRYRRQNIPVGYGWLEGTHFTQRITHDVCVMEAKKQ